MHSPSHWRESGCFGFTGAVIGRRYTPQSKRKNGRRHRRSLETIPHTCFSNTCKHSQREKIRGMPYLVRHRRSKAPYKREYLFSQLPEALPPCLDFLERVYGLILALQGLDQANMVARSTRLSEGISTAMITTAGGLLIGIPALAFYAVLRSKADRILSQIESTAARIARHKKS